MKKNIINKVADLMLSEDDEMKSLGRAMFLENSPRESDILILENIIHKKLHPIESRFSKLELDIRRRQSPHTTWASGSISGTYTGSTNTAIGISYSSPFHTLVASPGSYSTITGSI
jgi:hypothetical protein